MGDDNSSRSEDLLPRVEQLLDQNGISLKQLQTIAVSTGPGSFTGLRVGIATAKALALSAGCRIRGISVLEAIVSSSASERKKIAVVSAGRGSLFWQCFYGKNLLVVSEIETGNSTMLQHFCDLHEAGEILMEPSAYRDYQQTATGQKLNVRVLEENIARLIGLQTRSVDKRENPEIFPCYLRPAI